MTEKDPLISKTLWINESLWEKLKEEAILRHARISFLIREAVKESLTMKKRKRKK